MNRLLLTTFLLLTFALSQAQVGFRFESVEALSPVINGEYEENSPVYDPIDKRLYFSRTLHPDNKGGKTVGQDLWYSDFDGNAWSQPSNDLNKLNNYLNNVTIGLSKDGQRMYMIGTYIKKVSLQSGFSMTEKKEDGDWPRPETVEVDNLNIKSPFYGGYISPSEDILIISMESFNSMGQEDLYVSLKTANGWGKPIWMGDSINSAGYEISPFLFEDGKTLMFASTGHGGQGDCDIFYSYRLDSSWTHWSKPVNAGKKINSHGFDAFPFSSGETFYFSSNRNDSLSNIYSAKNTLYYKEADILRLVFESFDSRAADIKIDVKDAKGELVGSFFPGSDDVFEISGLREKSEYTLTPSHPMLDLKLFNPQLLNKDGAYIEQLEYNDDGTLLLTPRLPEDVAAMPVLDKPAFQKGMQGVFEVDRTPISGIMLALVDADGKVYQYAQTQKKGAFTFANTPDSLDLKIQIVSDLEYIKKNGTIYYTDDQGAKLFKSVVNENGEFKYQKIQAREMAQLKSLSTVDTKINTAASPSAGVFSYENLPQDGVTLRLYDENNNLIEEVVTNEDGEFMFTKLRADQNFSIRPADEALVGGSLAFMDREGNAVSSLEDSEYGFRYQALDPELIAGLRLLEEDYDDNRLSQNFVFTIGLYKYKNLPTDGISLHLLDDNDNIIETVTTDASGHFVFSMLKPNQNYRVQVVGVTDTEMLETQLYFVDSDGTVNTAAIDPENMYAFERLDQDYFFNISQINSDEAKELVTESFKDVKGRFDYQSLGKEGVRLELLDENQKVIETVYTDSNGNFIFNKLAKESEYFVRLAEQDKGLLDEAQFIFENEENEELVQEGPTAAGFKFVTLAREDGSYAGMRLTENPELDITKFLPKEPQNINSSSPMTGKPAPEGEDLEHNDLKLKTIYFNFNSVRLSNNDRYRLNRVYPIIRNSGQPVLIVGHSCDLGDPKIAAEVSKMRAEIVRDYLVNLGIDPERIIIEGIGAPGEKLTFAQRLEMRRVDIFHLTP